MKITFLGTSHGIPEKDRFCSSILVSVDDNHYIIDAGAPIATLVKNHGVDPNDIKGIFITHSHGDHVHGLPQFTAMINVFADYEKARIPVFVPDEQKYREMFDFVFGKTDIYWRTKSSLFGENENENSRMRFQIYKEGLIFDDGTIKVTAIHVGHYVNAHAFLVESKDGKRALFCGDMRGDLADYPYAATEKENDIVVIEGAHQNLASNEIKAILRNTKTKKMILTHYFLKLNPKEIILELQNSLQDKFPLEIAYDNLIIEV